jgi:hypothetical protein
MYEYIYNGIVQVFYECKSVLSGSVLIVSDVYFHTVLERLFFYDITY